MLISLLHFSDIHFQQGHNVIQNRRIKVFDSIKNELIDKDAIFILISGDVAYSGKKEEYKIALDFISYFVNEIKTYIGTVPYVITIPGNHDCDFHAPQAQVRNIILKNFSENGLTDLSEELIEICCSHQLNYFNFRKDLNALGIDAGDIVIDHLLLQINTFKVGDSVIKFNLFNTSWDSHLHEKVGNLKYPIDYLADRIPSIDSKFSISVIHHPLNWQTPELSKELRTFLLQTSDFTISGHEHEGNSLFLKDLERDYNYIHIESPALQESDNDRNSAFNVVNLNTETEELQILSFKYTAESSQYNISNEPLWRKIEKGNKLKTVPFKLKNAYTALLNDPGAKFTHSKVDEVFLSDIYVPPYLKNVTMNKESKTKLFKFEHSDMALAINLEEEAAEDKSSVNEKQKFHKLILGTESSGKTAILKNFFLKYYEKGLYPVYISVGKITDVNSEKLKKIIGKEFKDQYDELESTFEQIDFHKVVILIDDLHKFKNINSKVALIRNLTKLFDKILITGNELMLFESYTNKQNKTVEIYETFDTYIIQEFNPSLRFQLINKWHRLGVDYLDTEEKNSFLRKLDQAAATISNIIGKNFIPAYPVYILSILQGMETGESDATNNKLHAYYYQLLITRSLKKVLRDKDEIGFYITLAKEYFFFLFDTKIRFSPISKDDFDKFLNRHKEKYKMSKLNHDVVLRTLMDSGILRITTEDHIGLAYKYLYYYFVALYLADNIDDSEIKKKIELMADRVYRDEYSNIIVFLIHLSRNPFIINKLIEKSRNIFASFTPLKLDNDVDFINVLQKSLPEQVLKHLNVEDSRKEELLEEDEMETMEKENELKSYSEDYDLYEDINSIDLLSQLTRALRTINILGQLTKKYWGELLGDQKYNLAEETLMLGLRTLKFEYVILEKSSEGLIEHVMKIVQKRFAKQNVTKEQVKDISENLIFNLAASAGFGVLKRITSSIGTEKLSDTFHDIEIAYPYNSTALVNLGIKLEHYKGFPIKDIEALKTENLKNPLGFSVLQNFVMDYMYMYELPYDKKQQICELMNIKMQDQRAIELTTQIKK